MPVAANCWFVPAGIDAVDGDTEIETSAGGPTVRFVEPVTEPDVAVMDVLP